MRIPVAIASAAVVSALLGASSPARADSMDPALERLVGVRNPDNTVDYTKSCTDSGRFNGSACVANNAAFGKLINQLGVVIAPTAMHSARTTGFGSFHLTFEGAFTGIDSDASYWQDGTRGPQDPANKKFSVRNSSPASLMQLYSVKVRKGFPFGLEVAAQVGTLAQTNIITGGADIRMSILEGFRKGALGILPDLAVGGGVRTATGTPQFNLTVASFDVQISKNLPVGESHILAPYVGFQQLWIFGDSGLIDATPKTDPLGVCNYSGVNSPGNPDPAKTTGTDKAQYYDGQPNCSGGRAADFNNTFTFDKVRFTRQRLIVGLSYRYEVVFLGAQFSTDIASPGDGGGRDNSKYLKDEKKQNAFAFELGAFF
jgi:hypothetical protein